MTVVVMATFENVVITITNTYHFTVFVMCLRYKMVEK